MKTNSILTSVKVILLMVVLAVLSVLAYKLLSSRGDVSSLDVVPATVAEKKINKDIDSLIVDAQDNHFCKQDYEYVLNRINLFFKDQPSTKKTYTLRLNSEYTEVFVRQANYVFNRQDWKAKDIKFIREETNRLLVILPDHQDLNYIRNTVLKQYDALCVYNNKVIKACKQTPKCCQDPVKLYLPDGWDCANTRSLMESTPNYSGVITNSRVYRMTRKTEVTARLKKAHKDFMENKLACAEKEFQSFNYNSSRHGDWEKICEIIRNDCREYYDLWKLQTIEWQKRLNEGEKYAMPEEPSFELR